MLQTGEPHIFYRKKPEDGNLKNAVTTKDVYNIIRMLDAESYPHAFIEIGPFKIEFTEAFKDGKFVEAKG